MLTPCVAVALGLAAFSSDEEVERRGIESFWGWECPQTEVEEAPHPQIQPKRWWVSPRPERSDGLFFDRYLRGAHPRRPSSESTLDDVERTWEPRSADELAGAQWAYTTVHVEEAHVRMADLQGAELFFVNGEPFVGDVERHGFRGVPVALRQGANEVFVRAVGAPFELSLWSPTTRTVIGTWDVAVPPHGDPERITYAVFNASAEPIPGALHVHYGHAVLADGPRSPEISDWSCGNRMLPLGVCVAGTYFIDAFTDRSQGVVPGRESLTPVVTYFAGDVRPDRELLRTVVPELSSAQDREPRSRNAVSGGLFERATRGLTPDHGVTLVYGTRGTAEEASALLARARFDQETLWYRARITPQAVSDDDFLEIVRQAQEKKPGEVAWIQRHAILLYGNEDTNAAWSFLVPEDCPIHVRRGVVQGPDLLLRGDDVTGWFLTPRADVSHRRPMVVVCDTGAEGTRLGSFMRTIVDSLREEELAFYSSEGLRDGSGPRLLVSGSFDGLGGIVR